MLYATMPSGTPEMPTISTPSRTSTKVTCPLETPLVGFAARAGTLIEVSTRPHATAASAPTFFIVLMLVLIIFLSLNCQTVQPRQPERRSHRAPRARLRLVYARIARCVPSSATSRDQDELQNSRRNCVSANRSIMRATTLPHECAHIPVRDALLSEAPSDRRQARCASAATSDNPSLSPPSADYGRKGPRIGKSVSTEITNLPSSMRFCVLALMRMPVLRQ